MYKYFLTITYLLKIFDKFSAENKAQNYNKKNT